MVEEILEKNRVMMTNFRKNILEAKQGIYLFITLCKYIQQKERLQRINDAKVN